MTPPKKKASPGGSGRPIVSNGTPPASHDDPGRRETEDLDWQRDFFTRRRLEKARLPRRFMGKTLANFKGRDKKRRHLVEDARKYITSFQSGRELPQGLRMSGPVGCGKSHLAAAILKDVMAKGYSGLFYNSPDLLRDIRATFNSQGELTEDELIEEITGVDLLVLDDVGAEKISEFVLDRFYLIVNKRYEGFKPMIVTTNMDEEEMISRIGERTVSRLIEMCQTFGPFPDEDYRRKMMH